MLAHPCCCCCLVFCRRCRPRCCTVLPAGGCRRCVDRQGGDQCAERGGGHEGCVCGESELSAALSCDLLCCRAAWELLAGPQADGCCRCCTCCGCTAARLGFVIAVALAPTPLYCSRWAAPRAAAQRLSRRRCGAWTATACSAQPTSAAGCLSQVRWDRGDHAKHVAAAGRVDACVYTSVESSVYMTSGGYQCCYPSRCACRSLLAAWCCCCCRCCSLRSFHLCPTCRALLLCVCADNVLVVLPEDAEVGEECPERPPKVLPAAAAALIACHMVA